MLQLVSACPEHHQAVSFGRNDITPVTPKVVPIELAQYATCILHIRVMIFVAVFL